MDNVSFHHCKEIKAFIRTGVPLSPQGLGGRSDGAPCGAHGAPRQRAPAPPAPAASEAALPGHQAPLRAQRASPRPPRCVEAGT